jgi:hypothetical protein
MKNYQEIIDNRVNGNIKDFKQQVKEMDKYEMLRLINYVRLGHQGEYPKLHNLLIWLEDATE